MPSSRSRRPRSSRSDRSTWVRCPHHGGGERLLNNRRAHTRWRHRREQGRQVARAAPGGGSRPGVGPQRRCRGCCRGDWRASPRGSRRGRGCAGRPRAGRRTRRPTGPGAHPEIAPALVTRDEDSDAQEATGARVGRRPAGGAGKKRSEPCSWKDIDTVADEVPHPKKPS
jgi:hypothetical protein